MPRITTGGGVFAGCAGRRYKMLTVLDEFTRQVLSVIVRIEMGANDILKALYPRLLKHGIPECIRSDNGPEFAAERMRIWLRRVRRTPIRIYPGALTGEG